MIKDTGWWNRVKNGVSGHAEENDGGILDDGLDDYDGGRYLVIIETTSEETWERYRDTNKMAIKDAGQCKTIWWGI